MKVFSIIILIGMIIGSCKSSLKVQNEADVLSIAGDYFKGKEYVLYSNGPYALVHSQIIEDPLKPEYLLEYFVFNKDQKKIIEEGTVVGGYVKWFNETKIEIYSAPGFAEGDKTKDDYTRIYDIISKEEFVKSKYLHNKKEQ